MISPKLYIKNTAGKGRGMFTSKAFDQGVVVEISPVLVMSAADRKLLDQTLLHDYIFEWAPEGVVQCCMAMGYVPVYNHSYESNCEYYMNYEDETITIKTVRAIEAGEELTINYNGDWNDAKQVWFEVT